MTVCLSLPLSNTTLAFSAQRFGLTRLRSRVAVHPSSTSSVSCLLQVKAFGCFPFALCPFRRFGCLFLRFFFASFFALSADPVLLEICVRLRAACGSDRESPGTATTGMMCGGRVTSTLLTLVGLSFWPQNGLGGLPRVGDVNPIVTTANGQLQGVATELGRYFRCVCAFAFAICVGMTDTEVEAG